MVELQNVNQKFLALSAKITEIRQKYRPHAVRRRRVTEESGKRIDGIDHDLRTLEQLDLPISPGQGKIIKAMNPDTVDRSDATKIDFIRMFCTDKRLEINELVNIPVDVENIALDLNIAADTRLPCLLMIALIL